MNRKDIWNKILKKLKVSPAVGGLEISDSILRWSLQEGLEVTTRALRLPPGIIVQGEVKKPDDFVAALKELKNQIGDKERSSVIVSLGSLKVFMQVISLPVLKDGNIEKAIELNMQMSSPIPFDSAYAGYQFLRRIEEEGKAEYLAAFVNKETINEIVRSLDLAGFVAVAVEPRALSIARFIKKYSRLDTNKSYIATGADSSGLEFTVLKGGSPFFEYFNSWQDLEHPDKQISLEDFKVIMSRNLNQVLNFYKTHWPDPISSIILINSNFSENIKALIEETTPFKVEDLKSQLNSYEGDWIICLGASIRGASKRRSDSDISLLGWDAKEEFKREQILSFMRVWRLLIPSSLLVLVLALVGVRFMVGNAMEKLKAQPAVNLSSDQMAQMKDLESKVQEFNKKVSMLDRVSQAYSPKKVDILDNLKPALDSNKITLNRLYTLPDGSMSLSGESSVNENMLSFKKALESTPGFYNVNLPFTNIQTGPQGFTFSMTFSFKSPNTR